MTTDTQTGNRPLGSEGPSNRDGLSYTLTAEVHRHLRYTLGTSASEATPQEVLDAVSHAVRNLVLDRLLVTEARQGQSKRVAHIALSHDPGRLLRRHVLAMGLQHAVKDALKDLGLHLHDLSLQEQDPALGDADPGRANTSLLESLATLDLPTTAYGIRFDYGQFKQVIVDGKQHAVPNEWDADRSPWLVRRATEAVWVPVFGRVTSQPPAPGEPTSTWVDWQLLVGVPWDMPVVGHGGRTVQRLRLFAARADIEIDVTTFDEGDFQRTIRERLARESVSKLMVPVDETLKGQELRLLQEYFLVACSVRDILRVHEQRELPVTELRSTHHLHLEGEAAALTIAELQRAFVDEYRIDWDVAWNLTHSLITFETTRRPTQRFHRQVLARILPRHLQILDVIQARYAGDAPLFTDGLLDPERLGRVGAHATAPLHPARSPRIWLQPHNEPLASLLTNNLGHGWLRNGTRLRELASLADQPSLQAHFLRTRTANKIKACSEIQRRTARSPDPGSMFILSAAPFSPLERPLLAALDALLSLLDLEDKIPPLAPTTFLFAGKACPADHQSKRVIELVHAIAKVVRDSPICRGRLDLHYVPNLDHRATGILAPAADVVLSLGVPGQTAGSIAMLAAMHGAHTVSARNQVGKLLHQHLSHEGASLFGAEAETLASLPRRPPSFDAPLLSTVIDALISGRFGDFSDLRHHLLYRDTTFILTDLSALHSARRRTLASFSLTGAADALTTIARSGALTSDAVAHHAARTHWQIERC